MHNRISARKAAQAGFTLIELIIVIVIIGILAAVAIPKYTDLKDSAEQAAVDAVAGNLATASALNYALVSSGKTTDAYKGCAHAGLAGLLSSGWPAGYTSTGNGLACVLEGPTGKTANWTASH